MFELIAGVFAVLVALIGVLLKQRNNARKKADDANRVAAHERAARDQEQRINASREKAREDAANVQREADERPATDRPTGSFRR